MSQSTVTSQSIVMSQSAVALQSAVKVLDAAELFPSMIVRKMLLCILVTVKTTHSFLHNI